MRTSVLVAAVAAIFCATAAEAIPLPRPRPNIVTFSSDRMCMASAMYKEARDQRHVGQLFVGNSIRRRAELNRPDLGGNSICGVVCYDGQYDGVRCARGWVPKETAAWQEALKAADKVLSGYRPSFPWSEAIYYLKPEESGTRSRCWFAKALVEVGWLKDHLFYREPLPEEAERLKKRTLPPECSSKKFAGT
jgi:spore germination cell wall hydrolase CwlJ-like protein